MLTKEDFVAIVVATSRDKNALDKSAKVIKLMEEVGELAKSVLAQDGKVEITPDMETPIGELADIVLMLIDIAHSCYPHLSGGELYTQLQGVIWRKYTKWVTYMDLKTPIEPIDDEKVQLHWASIGYTDNNQ